MRWLIVLVGVVAVLLILGRDENSKEPQGCPSCGVRSLHERYEGHNKPLRWVCDRCGYEAIKK